MSDKFFRTTKKGEMYDLKKELNDSKQEKKKDAVKRVIASMTVGKDVSPIFPDVVSCMQTTNLELKKLVYLYLMNYAKSNPDLAIMAVNTFIKDAQDHNPLIRALSIRTMGCIRVEKISEYLCEPLKEAMKDADPYVRKTAAICVAKFYDISPAMVEEVGFMDTLRGMLSDANHMVVANAVAALTEISQASGKDYLQLNSQIVNKLLLALNECTEWGQVFILDALVHYEAKNTQEVENIIERVAPRLQLANSAVVLSSVKVIMKLMDALPDANEMAQAVLKKMGPPIVTLLTGPPEIQYIALRNISFIIQKRPSLLAGEIKVFCCKYNDPIYVKMEKVDILVSLTTERSVNTVLAELKEYATEVDIDFVKKSVHAIGRCAVKLEVAAERCINVLLELIQTRVSYVVQEAIVVIKDIFRRYPNQYESIIGALCENLDSLDDPDAKSSMIWIIGEYSERIENANELLESFLENMMEESVNVQLQLLTAIVKLYLKKPEESQEIVKQVLEMTTQESDNPDLRDRAYVYWRLLSSNLEAAKSVVLAEKPLITDDSHILPATLLDDMMRNVGMLASVYHKPPEAFTARSSAGVFTEAHQDDEEARNQAEEIANVKTAVNEIVEETGGQAPPTLVDLLGIGPTPTTTRDVITETGPVGAVQDLLADAFGSGFSAGSSRSLPILLDANTNGKGLELRGKFERQNGGIVLHLKYSNNTMQPLGDNSLMALKFNKNTYNASPANSVIKEATLPLMPGASGEVFIPINTPATLLEESIADQIQCALKVGQNVLYFSATLGYNLFLQEDGNLPADRFIQLWKSIPNQTTHDLTISYGNAEQIVTKLTNTNLFVVNRRSSPTGFPMIYCSGKSQHNVMFLLEITLGTMNSVQIAAKVNKPSITPLLISSLQEVLV